MGDYEYNKSLFDMATAMKMISPFYGNNNEDINEWIERFNVTTAMLGFNSEDSRRLLAASMRGAATSWLAKIKMDNPQATLQTIISSLKMRFTSKEKVSKVARKIFTETRKLKTTSELQNLIEDANYVYQANHLGTDAIVEAICPRLPDILKDRMFAKRSVK